MNPWPNFPPEELRCNCGCGQASMDIEFMDRLQQMRTEAGFPFVLTSAYRCPDYNARVSGTGRHGPHTTGKAVDVAVQPHRAYEFLRLAYKHGFTGIGLGLNKGFIHIDALTEADGPRYAVRPNAWGYPA